MALLAVQAESNYRSFILVNEWSVPGVEMRDWQLLRASDILTKQRLASVAGGDPHCFTKTPSLSLPAATTILILLHGASCRACTLQCRSNRIERRANCRLNHVHEPSPCRAMPADRHACLSPLQSKDTFVSPFTRTLIFRTHTAIRVSKKAIRVIGILQSH